MLSNIGIECNVLCHKDAMRASGRWYHTCNRRLVDFERRIQRRRKLARCYYGQASRIRTSDLDFQLFVRLRVL